MNKVADLPVGYLMGREEFHDWSNYVAITREQREDGTEFCICWIGTFTLATTDSGGWQPEDGAALGVDSDGEIVVRDEWVDIPGMDEASDVTRRHPRWPLDQALQIARQLAQAATCLLPAIDLSFEMGDTLDHFEAAYAHYRGTGGANSWEEAVLVVGLGLLWLSESARRDG